MYALARGEGFPIRPKGNIPRQFFEHAALKIFEPREQRGSD